MVMESIIKIRWNTRATPRENRDILRYRYIDVSRVTKLMSRNRDSDVWEKILQRIYYRRRCKKYHAPSVKRQKRQNDISYLGNEKNEDDDNAINISANKLSFDTAGQRTFILVL